MKRNRRRHHRSVTFTEGVKGKIADLFLRALMHNRPADETHERFIERFFAVGTRFLFFVKATQEFALGGRMVYVGDKLLVRHDTRDDFFELCTVADMDFVNELSAGEWRAISRRLQWDDDADRPPPAVLMGVSIGPAT